MDIMLSRQGKHGTFGEGGRAGEKQSSNTMTSGGGGRRMVWTAVEEPDMELEAVEVQDLYGHKKPQKTHHQDIQYQQNII